MDGNSACPMEDVKPDANQALGQTDMAVLSTEALDVLMPLYLALDSEGKVRLLGPTVPRLFDLHAEDTLIGQSFFDLFDVRRPRAAHTIDDLLRADRGRLRVIPKHPNAVTLKGIAVPCHRHGGAILNLSFGIAGIDAIQRHSLTARDFAHTDPTIELLYLHEANTVAMVEGKRLNQRLQIAHAAAEHRALTDALTGLKNRRALENLVERLISDCEPFTLIHLDLDKFKYVNDTYGHAAGDEVLQAVASRLSGLIRATDSLARIGGDEFVLVMRNTTIRNQIGPAAARIIAGLEEPVPFNGVNLEISCSIGITISTIYTPPTSAQMQHDADMALYKSKHDGRGRYTFFADLPPTK